MAKAEKVISEYNKCVEEEEKQLEEIKKAVQDMSEMMIRTLEEKRAGEAGGGAKELLCCWPGHVHGGS